MPINFIYKLLSIEREFVYRVGMEMKGRQEKKKKKYTERKYRMQEKAFYVKQAYKNIHRHHRTHKPWPGLMLVSQTSSSIIIA